jgi:hypothetical protein
MNTPLRDNEHIRADGRAFMESYRRARTTLGKIAGVVGVGYGLRERKGAFGSEIAILVYVTAKRPEGSLAPGDLIPPTFEGYRTDVRVLLPETRTGLMCDDDTPYPTITGGIQIEAAPENPSTDTAAIGTLGCIVRKRGDTGDDNVYLLTNEHVLLEVADVGDGVYQPYAPRGTLEGTQLGKIEREYLHQGHVDSHGRPVVNEPSTHPPPDETEIDPSFEGFYVDGGAVRINLGSFCCGSECITRNDIRYDTTIPFLNTPPLPRPGVGTDDLNRITDVRDLRLEDPASVVGAEVIKVGRKTGRTVGRITGVNVPGHSIVRYPPENPIGKVTGFRYHIIEIALADDPPAVNRCAIDADDPPLHPGRNSFSWSGDSGSLIVDERNRAIGLLYGNSLVANDDGRYLTRACFIVPVLDVLGMCIPTTTGTAHGSSNATDGSGLTAYAGPFDLPQDDGKVLFASAASAAVPVRPRRAPSSEMVTLTDTQRARMLRLLDEFRKTERNRRLHDSFGQVRRELAYLVRSSQPVKRAWHRCRGPAFLACAISHLKGEADSVPREIGGVSRAELLVRMGKVLYEHGSNPLKAAIERHRDELMLLIEAETAQACIEILRHLDVAEVSE